MSTPGTFGALIDRTFLTYLEPPDSQPATARLQAPITDADLTLTIGGFALIEDEELLRPECKLELGSEVVIVTSYDPDTGICGIERGADTTPAAHAAGARIKLAPPFARDAVANALADNIITLFPDLYTVNTLNLATVGGTVAAIDDPLAVEVIEAWGENGHGGDIEARLVDFHPSVGGRAVILGGYAGSFWIRYRRRFGDVTSEEDTFEELGLESRWATIVMVGACADLFIGRDIPSVTSSFIQSVVEAENVPVGTRVGIAQQLASYRQRLLNEAKQEMRAEYKTRISQPQVVQTSWWG